MTPEIKLEAILFFKGETVEMKELESLLGLDDAGVRAVLTNLQRDLSVRGVRVITNGTSVQLVTAPELGEFFDTLRKEELARELTKAAAETLAIVLYQGPVSRSEIDYIRGVNSTFILRNLQVRGLVEKITRPGEERRFLYQPSVELFAHLGITALSDLPEFDKVKRELAAFISEKAEMPEAKSSELPEEEFSEEAVYDSREEYDNRTNER